MHRVLQGIEACNSQLYCYAQIKIRLRDHARHNKAALQGVDTYDTAGKVL